MQMQAVDAYEAKTKLGELWAMVGKGESCTITHHGMSVAAVLAELNTGQCAR
jgi:antitoxin (DNA-binding transcriptional repressor) of toxin-antitoxin stability system